MSIPCRAEEARAAVPRFMLITGRAFLKDFAVEAPGVRKRRAPNSGKKQVSLYLQLDEFEKLAAGARAAGCSLSTFIKEKALGGL